MCPDCAVGVIEMSCFFFFVFTLRLWQRMRCRTTQMTRTWNTGPLCSGCLFLLLVVCVGGFVDMGVLGCGKLDLGVRAAKSQVAVWFETPTITNRRRASAELISRWA